MHPAVDCQNPLPLLITLGGCNVSFNNVRWYVKGGAAVTDSQYSSFFTGTNIVFNQASETR